MEMTILREIVGIARLDHTRNELVKKRLRVENSAERSGIGEGMLEEQSGEQRGTCGRESDDRRSDWKKT